MPKEFCIYADGLVHSSVCTSLTDEQATSRINEQLPTGIASQWEISPDEKFSTGEWNGCPCETFPDTHRHILFNC